VEAISVGLGSLFWLHIKLILEALLSNCLRTICVELIVLHLLGCVPILLGIHLCCLLHELKFLLILDVFHQFHSVVSVQSVGVLLLELDKLLSCFWLDALLFLQVMVNVDLASRLHKPLHVLLDERSSDDIDDLGPGVVVFCQHECDEVLHTLAVSISDWLRGVLHDFEYQT